MNIKTIGLIGGMSWESTATYYQLLNRLTREARGGLHSAELVLWSFDFAEIEALQARGDWAGASRHMVSAAQKVEQAGAQCLLICTNTMHRMADEVGDAISIPLLHIADATAAAITRAGVHRPVLLATRYTMEEDFYKGRMHRRHGIDAMVPKQVQREVIHNVIYNELCRGIVADASKSRYLEIIAACLDKGADSLIFGCTEVGLLISQDDFDVPVFDSVALHAQAAIDFALSDGKSDGKSDG